WITDPGKAVPGNFMGFAGLPEARGRADLVAYLQAAAEGKAPAPRSAALPDLKKAPAEATVTAMRHCGDSYFVTTGSGATLPFWECNSRYKTDSGPSGAALCNLVLLGRS